MFVTREAAARSSGGPSAITNAWRAGTSICETDAEQQHAMASGAVGTKPARIRNRFAGRCVNTIVRMRPIRAATR